MEKITGNDNFNGTFDFFEWSAPYYDNEIELAKFFVNYDCDNKKLSGINIIGHVGKGRRGYWNYDLFSDIGLHFNPLRSWWLNDEMRNPWEVLANEPIQLQFDDGTTLEILPMESGGARVGCNTIPSFVHDGSSYSNFDANDFFAELLGGELQSIRVKTVEERTNYYHEFEIKHERYDPEIRTKRFIEFRFNSSSVLTIEYDWTSRYYISLRMEIHNNTIKNSRIKQAFSDSNFAVIINGCTSNGEFLITPDLPEESDGSFESRYRISIDDLTIDDYLGVLLYHYYDPSIQKKEYEGEYVQPHFDHYGSNYYSAELIRQMISDLKKISDMLVNDYENSELDNIKKSFRWWPYTDKEKDELTESERDELRKKDVPCAVDFYKRFIKWAERVLEFPGCEGIYFAGP